MFRKVDLKSKCLSVDINKVYFHKNALADTQAIRVKVVSFNLHDILPTMFFFLSEF